MVALLASMPVSPLVLEVNAPREVFEGEPIPMTASLVNRSQKPMVIVRPYTGNMKLGMSLNSNLLRDNRTVPVTETGMNIYQAMEPWEYGKFAFQTLKPGEKLKIEDIQYRQEFLGEMPSRKDDWNTAPRSTLKAGEYTIHIAYGFDRSGKPRLKKDAQALYQSAWAGFLDLRQSVTIRPRP